MPAFEPGGAPARSDGGKQAIPKDGSATFISSMALRIHLPWGALLTALGFGAIAAGAAWLHAVDDVGHLYGQLALHAVGGMILGTAAWAFSERVAYAANLNTKPMLRLTLAGIVASYAGAWVASPHTELTAGAPSVVAPVLSVVLYAAAGILPLIAVLALLSFFETLFAAQRGGGNVASALKPVLSHAALGIALGAVTGFVAWSLREEIVSTVVAITGDAKRTSGWIDRRRALFTDVLRGSGCEVLVVPLEPAPVAAAKPERSLDRPARSLITREIAAQIHQQTGLCVADPTLVARALGEGARELRSTQVWKLADAIGASWIVRGTVELEQEQLAYSIRLGAFARGSGKGAWAAGEGVQSGPLSFSDELPPEAAFAPVVAQTVAQLGLPAAGGSEQSAATSAAHAFPRSPLELPADPGSAVERARRLQLLAAIGGNVDTAAEHLWERSLIALREAQPADEAVRVLRARAALHLYRRPYALTLLRGLPSGEAQVMHELAQGNLTRAEALAAQIADPASRLIIELELAEARLRYGVSVGARARRDILLKQYPGYAALLHPALSGEEWFQPISHELVQQQLAALGVQIEDNSVATPLRAIGSYLGEDMLMSNDMSRHAVAIERSYAPLWRMRAAGWRAQRAFDRLAEWDYYDALYAANRLALANPALAIAARRAQSAALMESVHELSPTFAGYPPLAAGVLWSLRSQQQTLAKPDLLLSERERRLNRDLIAWEGGETRTVRNVQGIASAEPAYYDEPPRAWRPAHHAGPADPARVEQRLRALAYTQYGFRNLLEAYQALQRAGRPREMQQVAAQAQERFMGSPEREAFLLALAEESGDTAAYVAILEQSLTDRPEEWDAYDRLARGQLAARHPEQAQRTLLAFPLFRGDRADARVLAGHAQAGAELLLDAGETDLARALLQLCMQYRTESAAHLRCELRLAQLDGQWSQAIAAGRQLYERYKDPWGIAYGASASFLIGETDEGFRLFFEASKQIEDMRPWWAALAGHRIAATPEDELIGFAHRWQALSGRTTVQNALRDHFLFNALLIDRAPGDKTVQGLIAMTQKNGDALYKAWITGYTAFKRGNFTAAADALAPLAMQDAVKADDTKAITAAALPYAVASLARASRVDEARALLDAWQQKLGRDFHVLLASAYMQALSGDTARALLSLWQAHLAWPALSGEATVPTFFQILETCEKLHEWTGDDRYRVLLLDLARRQGEVWPWPWAYSFEAKHAKDAAERARALAMALFLDPQSEHLAGFTKTQREAAAGWFQRNGPFTKKQ